MILIFLGCKSPNSYEKDLKEFNETLKDYNVLLAQHQQYGINREILILEQQKKKIFYYQVKDTSRQNYIKRTENHIKEYKNIKKTFEELFKEDEVSLKSLDIFNKKLFDMIKRLDLKNIKNIFNDETKKDFETISQKLLKSDINIEKKWASTGLKEHILNLISNIFKEASIYSIPVANEFNYMCGFGTDKFYILVRPHHDKIILGETCDFDIVIQNGQKKPVLWQSDLLFDDNLFIENVPDFIKRNFGASSSERFYEIQLPLTQAGKKQISFDVRGFNLYQDTSFRYTHEIDVLPN